MIISPMFRLSGVRIFMGANIHCGFAAIAGHLEVTPGMPPLPIDRICALYPYLVKLLPGLASTEFLRAPDCSKFGDDAPAALATTLAVADRAPAKPGQCVRERRGNCGIPQMATCFRSALIRFRKSRRRRCNWRLR